MTLDGTPWRRWRRLARQATTCRPQGGPFRRPDPALRIRRRL